MFPTRDSLTICFAHAAYQMKDRFDARDTGIKNFQVRTYDELVKLVPDADFVALTCALTPETTGLMSAAAFAAMKPSSVFVNVARGKVADEAALIATMKAGKIWAAGLDVTVDEPLPESSPLWTMPNVFITPHTAGETRAYEDNVIDILIENLDRLWRDEKTLRNQVL